MFMPTMPRSLFTVNIDHTVGAVGFVPRFAHKFYPVTVVRCDEETGEPIRDEAGRCIRCKPGEAGVFIGKINVKRAANSFGGYADKVRRFTILV